MKILIDTNIIVTFLTKREDKYSEAIDIIMQKCIDKKLDGYIAFHSLSTLWYVLRHSPINERLYSLTLVCSTFKIASASRMRILRAIKNSDFTDFEDNLQDCCAQQVNADYIVTANVRDYDTHSVVKAVTPSELLDILNDSYTDSPWEIHEQYVEYNSHSCAIPSPPHLHILISSQVA